MSPNLRPVLIGFLLAALPAAGRAAYDDVGVSARAHGLGGAFTAVADDVYATHYNPAGLAFLARPELGTSYAKLLTGLSDSSNLQNSFVAYGHPLKAGRHGTVAGAWNYFTLDSLYRETSLYGSYGRGMFTQAHPNKFYGGASLKYLHRSLGGVSAAGSAIGPTGIATGQQDPVLQDSSKSNVDVDLGFIMRVRPRWTVGLAIQHFLEPNVAFSGNDTDKLGRVLNLGGAYRTPFSTLSAELKFPKAPDGSTDKIMAVAAEKWLPTLIHGTFGVRGGLSVGSRSFRQVATGLSYKIARLQFDYGFTIPLGGLSGTMGTHRLGVTLRFGKHREATPLFAEALLENLRDMGEVGTPEFRYEMEELALFKRTAIEQYLKQARVEVKYGRIADALGQVEQAAALKPADPKIEASAKRLRLLAPIVPVIENYGVEPAQAALYEGALEYLLGNDKTALRKFAYAQSLNPADARLESLLQAVEAQSGAMRPAPAAPTAPSEAPAVEPVLAGKAALMEVALREREYVKVVALAAELLTLDPSNALAHKRLGAAQYGLKNYPEALKSLRTAYRLETDGEAKGQLRSYIDALQTLAEKKAREVRGAEPEPRRTPQEVERLYEAGVDLYAQGRLSEAASVFRKILEIDRDNIQARRALDRVQAEILRSNERR